MVRYKPPVALLPFLKPGYGKLKRENKPQAKSPECLYLGPAPSHPRDAVRGLNKHRTLLFTRHVSWQRVTLASPVPAQVHGLPVSGKGGAQSRRRKHVKSRWGGGDERAGRKSRSPDRPRRDVGGVICTRSCRNTHRRHLPPAMLATGQSSP